MQVSDNRKAIMYIPGIAGIPAETLVRAFNKCPEDRLEIVQFYIKGSEKIRGSTGFNNSSSTGKKF